MTLKKILIYLALWFLASHTMWLEANAWEWDVTDYPNLMFYFGTQGVIIFFVWLMDMVVQSFFKEFDKVKLWLPRIAIPVLFLSGVGVWVTYDQTVYGLGAVTSLIYIWELAFISPPIICIMIGVLGALIVTIVSAFIPDMQIGVTTLLRLRKSEDAS